MSDSLRPRGPAVRGILQARILESLTFPFARGFSQPRDQTQVSLTEFKTSLTVYFWNLPFNIFGPQVPDGNCDHGTGGALLDGREMHTDL